MCNLFRLSGQVLSDLIDQNYFYLFNLQAFVTAKSLNLFIPGGPRFEPMFRDMEFEGGDWDEFNDVSKVIVRVSIRTEYKIAFPHLYNCRPRKVWSAKYHEPMVLYVKCEDPDLPAFYFDKMLNPFLGGKDQSDLAAARELEDCGVCPKIMSPFLEVCPL